MKWPKKKSQYAYSISVHKEAVHIAILKAINTPVPPEQVIEWRNRQWELMVNDDIDVVNEDVPAALEQLLKRYEKLTTKNQPLQLVLGCDLTQEVSVEKPALADAEIAAALQWTLKDLVSIPATDIIADFYDLPVQASGGKKIQVVAASRAFLQPLLNILHTAQFNIHGIVNSTLAFSLWFDSNEQLIVLTQSLRSVSQLQIISHNQLILSRELNRIKPLGVIALDDTNELDALALEVQRSLDFYTGQLRQAPLAELCIATEHAQAESIVANLGAQLGLKHKVLLYPEWAQELKNHGFSDLEVLSGLLWLTQDTETQSNEVVT